MMFTTGKLSNFQRKVDVLSQEQALLIDEIDNELYLQEKMFGEEFPKPVSERRKELNQLRRALVLTMSSEAIL